MVEHTAASAAGVHIWNQHLHIRSKEKCHAGCGSKIWYESILCHKAPWESWADPAQCKQGKLPKLSTLPVQQPPWCSQDVAWGSAHNSVIAILKKQEETMSITSMDASGLSGGGVPQWLENQQPPVRLCCTAPIVASSGSSPGTAVEWNRQTSLSTNPCPSWVCGRSKHSVTWGRDPPKRHEQWTKWFKGGLTS